MLTVARDSRYPALSGILDLALEPRIRCDAIARAGAGHGRGAHLASGNRRFETRIHPAPDGLFLFFDETAGRRGG